MLLRAKFKTGQIDNISFFAEKTNKYNSLFIVYV